MQTNLSEETPINKQPLKVKTWQTITREETAFGDVQGFLNENGCN